MQNERQYLHSILYVYSKYHVCIFYLLNSSLLMQFYVKRRKSAKSPGERFQHSEIYFSSQTRLNNYQLFLWERRDHMPKFVLVQLILLRVKVDLDKLSANFPSKLSGIFCQVNFITVWPDCCTSVYFTFQIKEQRVYSWYNPTQGSVNCLSGVLHHTGVYISITYGTRELAYAHGEAIRQD